MEKLIIAHTDDQRTVNVPVPSVKKTAIKATATTSIVGAVAGAALKFGAQQTVVGCFLGGGLAATLFGVVSDQKLRNRYKKEHKPKSTHPFA